MALTNNQIKALQPEEKAKKYFDGFGLYLEVTPTGSKLWRIKYRFENKEKRLSLGVYPSVSLKEAREAAQDAKRLVAQGLDPSLERRKGTTTANLAFKTIAESWLETNKDQWTPDHHKKLTSKLTDKIYPRIGAMDIATITPDIILSLCKNIETTISSYTAQTIHSLISRIFRYAVAYGHVPSDPCRDLRGALKPHKEKNMPAITDPVEVGKLALKIDRYEGMPTTRAAMQLMLLFMCRTKEIRGMRWKEVDFTDKLWRIPGDRMKMGREHLVPLSTQALDILRAMQPLTGGGNLVFPSYCRERKNTPMGKNTINNALHIMGYENGEIVGHGFRSAASTILNELGWNRDAVELQLAHVPTDKVRAAYNRAAYLDERRRMLQAWADHLDTLKERASQP